MSCFKAMPDRLKLWGLGLRHVKCELVAAFADVDVEIPPFTPGITNKTPRYLAMNPMGKVSAHLCTLSDVLWLVSAPTHIGSFWGAVCAVLQA